jgi:AcrR family transcriptional regulator
VNRPIQHKPEKILAASQSVFADEGVGVSTAKIATFSGVSNGTLFNYFPTKQALIDALYVSIKTNLGEAVGEFDDTEPIERRMRQVWNRWFRWASQNRDAHLVMNLLRQAGLASAEAQATGNAAILGPVRVLNQAKDSGVLVDLPLEHLAALVQHHLDQAVASELDDRQAELAFHVLWNGITEQPNTSLVKDSS